MIRVARSQRVFDVSPAWEIWGNSLVGFDLSLTAGFELAGVSAYCMDDPEREGLSRSLGQMLAAVPPRALLRFYSLELASYREELERFRGSFEAPGIGQQIAHEKVLQCATSIAPIKRELLCFVSTAPAVRDLRVFTPAQLRGHALRMGKEARERLIEQSEHLAQAAEGVAMALRTAGVGVRSLNKAALFKTLWRMSNPLRSLLFEAPELRTDQSLRSQLFASGMYNCLDTFERDGQLHRVVSLKVLPSAVYPGQILALQRMPFRNMMALTLRQVPREQAIAKVDGARDEALKWRQILPRLIGQERAVSNPDHIAEGKQFDGNAALQHLHAGDSLFEMALQVWFCAPDQKQLDRQTECLLSAVRACGNAEAAVEEYRGQFAYLGMLPGHHAWIGDRYHLMLGSRAADMIPIFQESTGAAKPSYLLTTRSQGLFGWDPFMPGLSAHNATVLGTTGKGKSFFLRLILTGFLARGGRVIVVTRGSDYHRYTDLHGGDVHDVSLEDPNLALGPFLPPEMVRGAKGRARLAHLSSILGLMAAKPGTALGRVERRLLFQACRRVYREAGDDTPTLSQWLDALRSLPVKGPREAEALQALEDEISFWTVGPAAAVFGRNRRPTSARLSVWNLAPIDDEDTRGVVLGLISGAIAQSIQAGPTVVVFDEVWSFLNSDAGAHLVSSLYRTVRKEGSCVWSISQSINDITQLVPQLRSGMLNNSPITVLLEQKETEIPEIQATFRLNDRQTEVLASLRSHVGYSSDALMLLGDQRHVVTLVPTPTEYWMATSHPQDVRVEAKVMRAYPKHSRAAVVRALAAKYPHGAEGIHA